ncbi:MAG: hypothetical protein F7B59_04870 [Desulfurococcales archaeon]|nr:hypothetical protein [Desulfurococcales archaeon]
MSRLSYYAKLSLSKHYNEVFHIIREYLEYRRQYRPDQECFTYAGLYNWYIRKKNGRLHWHTVERVIRRMAEDDWLERVHGRKVMIFCPSQYFKQALQEYEDIVNGRASSQPFVPLDSFLGGEPTRGEIVG